MFLRPFVLGSNLDIRFSLVPNRFQRMKETHPKMWDYCIREENGLGIGKVLDFIDVKYE